MADSTPRFGPDDPFAGYRAARAPSDDAVERMSTRLQSELAFADEPSARTLGWWLPRVLLPLAALLLLAWGVRAMGGREVDPTDVPTRGAASEMDAERQRRQGAATPGAEEGEGPDLPRRPQAAASAGAAVEAAVPEEAGKRDPSPPDVAELDAPSPARPSPRSESRAAADPPGGDAVDASAAESLAEQAKAIQAIEADLRAGRHGAAITKAEGFAGTFPAGQLAAEAEALRIVARCEAGHADAEADAASFLRAHPRTMLRRRIERACAEKNLGPQ